MEKGIKSGTTTVGLVCKDGIVLAAERKATMGYMIASKEDLKIVEIAPHIGMTQAGMVGDLQALGRYLKAETKLFELKNKKRITVKAAASLMASILYSGRWSFFPYMIQVILAGYDQTGPNLFILHPDGSKLEEKKFFSTGSGSPFAFGVLETSYKEGLTIEEAKKLASKSIKAAVERDIASGGKGMDIAVIDQKGFRLLKESEIKSLNEN
jgi:proteasome beta subunit